MATEQEEIHSAEHAAVSPSILIVGAGVFGLSTLAHLLTLPRYNATTLVLLDTHAPSLDPSPPAAADAVGTAENKTQWQPNPHAASIDSSRIVRPDYADAAYAELAIEAQGLWRKGYGTCGSYLSENDDGGLQKRIGTARQNTGERTCVNASCEHGPVYRESGMVLTGGRGGTGYVDKARVNAQRLGLDVQVLEGGRDVIRKFERGRRGNTGSSGTGVDGAGRGKEDGWRAAELGETGYINHSSGWVDNGRAMENVMVEVVRTARARNQDPTMAKVVFVRGKASRLLFSEGPRPRVTGVAVESEKEGRRSLMAALTILATGAHTPALVDLRGRAEARGQVVAYMPLSATEAAALRDMPVLLNLGTGMFIIPPVLEPTSSINGNSSMETTPSQQQQESTTKETTDDLSKIWILKVARHAYGYINPTPITLAQPTSSSSSSSSSPETTLHLTPSLPSANHDTVPRSALTALHSFLTAALPDLFPPEPNHPHRRKRRRRRRRSFISTRLCWYTDTPRADFIVTYHPTYHDSLFIATGGSGHAFKFMPVLGEKIVRVLELPPWCDSEAEKRGEELWYKWRWVPDEDIVGGGEGEGAGATEDGSRSGARREGLGDAMLVGGGDEDGVGRSKL